MSRGLAVLSFVLAWSSQPALGIEILTEENPPLNFTRDGQLTGTATLVVREMLQRAGVQTGCGLPRPLRGLIDRGCMRGRRAGSRSEPPFCLHCNPYADACRGHDCPDTETPMQVIANTLSGLGIGTAQTFSNLTLYPLLGQAALEPEYLVLDDALERKLARVTEISESGSVPSLAFVNDGDVPVLLLDGEELIGARQNRILNITILARRQSKTVIPVSCVEQGRWRYNSREFGSSDRALFLKARASKAQRVSESMRSTGRHASDQGEVWHHIAQKSVAFSCRSESGAMADVYEQEKVRLEEYVRAFSVEPGQTGALFAIDGRVAGIELFDCPKTFARYLPKLLRSYAMDAAETAKPKTAPPVDEAVKAFIAEMTAAAVERFKALGEGEDLRLNGETVAGGALVDGGRVVHLAAFKVDPDVPQGRRTSHRGPLRGTRS